MLSSRQSVEQEHPLTGYEHPGYARSLAEFGEPFQLPVSGGWLLRRPIPATLENDAMGCYPLFAAENWSGLAYDLDELSAHLVSVALVADPFGEYSPEQLRSCFDTVVAFKEHYVVDFSEPVSISKHHQYYAKKSTGGSIIEVGPPPDGFCAEWCELYASLVQRHGLRGIKAFSKAAFELQLKTPGMVVARALSGGSLVGAHLWYEQCGFAYSHLAAASEQGYELACSYGIYAASIEYFRERVRCVDLGGGAGVAAREDGLSWFKKGWANSTRTAYFCGRILNRERYDALTRTLGKPDCGYFPAYRTGELS
jgi:hypothetical protein